MECLFRDPRVGTPGPENQVPGLWTCRCSGSSPVCTVGVEGGDPTPVPAREESVSIPARQQPESRQQWRWADPTPTWLGRPSQGAAGYGSWHRLQTSTLGLPGYLARYFCLLTSHAEILCPGFWSHPDHCLSAGWGMRTNTKGDIDSQHQI